MCVLAFGGMVGVPANAVVTPRDKEWPLVFLRAEQVWERGAGAGVTVAVLDSGVDSKHPDLAGQVETGASFGGAGQDGDTDLDGHGTAMASLIAGTGRGADGAGIRGLAHEARILPVAVESTGDATSHTFTQGIRYAVASGAKVINISGGGPGDIPELSDAVRYAIGHDVVVVASAGNSGNARNEVDYPAGYPGVIAAAGVDRDGRPWSGSEYGPQVVLAAPASEQEVAYLNGGYGIGQGGTSPAAAWVSGAAAILRGLHPEWTAGQVIRQLIATARRPDGGTGRDDHYGYGIVDPLAAVTRPLAPGPTTNPLLGAASAAPGAPGAAAQSQTQVRGSLVRWAVGGGLALLLVVGALLVWALIAKRRQASGAPQVGGWPPNPGGDWPPGPRG